MGNASGCTIRQATVEDANAIASLCGELGYETSTVEAERRLKTLLNTKGHVVFVATSSDGSISGWIHIFGTQFLTVDAFAEIGGLVVTDTHREQGIGKALLSQAETWAEMNEFSRIRVRSRFSRHAAHMFYAQAGYEFIKDQKVFAKLI
ncbi:MAG: GNAT family N-acetyltransferase [Anaerolineales bacterium]|nr:GNAT family N-acetyltransferase [Anaerolineales bacterium]